MDSIDRRMQSFVHWRGEVPLEAKRLEDFEARGTVGTTQHRQGHCGRVCDRLPTRRCVVEFIFLSVLTGTTRLEAHRGGASRPITRTAKAGPMISFGGRQNTGGRVLVPNCGRCGGNARQLGIVLAANSTPWLSGRTRRLPPGTARPACSITRTDGISPLRSHAFDHSFGP